MNWGDTINRDGLLAQFEGHLSRSALAPLTIVNYLADLRAFLRWHEAANGADTSPLDLASHHIDAYCRYLRETRRHATSTVNRRLQALRKFYDFCIGEGWTAANPAGEVALLGDTSPQRVQCRTDADVERVMVAIQARNGHWPPRDRAILEVLLGAGLKLGELIALRLDEVFLDGAQPHLYVNDCAGRDVPLGAEACEILRAYARSRRAAPGIDRFFVNQDGNPLSTRSVQRLLHDCARAAGLDGLTAQDLRYIYARTVYDRCGDARHVGYLLGHRHLATTIRYLRPDSSEF